MATVLNIISLPTQSKLLLGLADASVYDTLPTAATMEITPPSFDTVVLPFNYDNYSVYSSYDLGFTAVGEALQPLPDGIYKLKYSISPAYVTYIERYIMRVEKIQEDFDKAFMTLDMMECDNAIKKQSKVELNTIYFFIQGSIAAANNCATTESAKLYTTASKMLSNFLKRNCGCPGTNYITNFG